MVLSNVSTVPFRGVNVETIIGTLARHPVPFVRKRNLRRRVSKTSDMVHFSIYNYVRTNLLKNYFNTSLKNVFIHRMPSLVDL